LEPNKNAHIQFGAAGPGDYSAEGPWRMIAEDGEKGDKRIAWFPHKKEFAILHRIQVIDVKEI